MLYNSLSPLLPVLPTPAKTSQWNFQSLIDIYNICAKLLTWKSHLCRHIYSCFPSIHWSRYFVPNTHYHSQYLPAHSQQISAQIYVHLFTFVAATSHLPNTGIPPLHLLSLAFTLQIHPLTCLFPSTSIPPTLLSTCATKWTTTYPLQIQFPCLLFRPKAK